MSDKLKHVVDEARGDFEVYDFNIEKGWGDIKEKVLPPSSGWRWQKISGFAASFVLFALATWYFGYADSTADELSEVEQYYTTEINHKVSLVKSHLRDARVLEDLEAMDQAFAELKADLNDNVDNEEVVAAMMENYQLKLQILEEILKELEKENREISN